VAAPSLNASELRFLRALLRRKARFIVVGLSAAALQGAPVVTQDVDLWFEDLSDPRIREALREVDAAYVAPSVLNPPMFAGGGVELFDIVLTMHGLGHFRGNGGTAWMSLGRLRCFGGSILASKRAANRAKDRLVIPVLEDSLAASGCRPARTEAALLEAQVFAMTVTNASTASSRRSQVED
jgi:hypothetical protein